MYARFYRWASDRLSDEGIVAFITNRSFIESRTFDGFRKLVAKDFQEIWLVDLGGDVRLNPKLSGTKHNALEFKRVLRLRSLFDGRLPQERLSAPCGGQSLK